VAILVCALIVGAGGLVPQVFSRPCLGAADALLPPRPAPVAAVGRPAGGDDKIAIQMTRLRWGFRAAAE